MANYNHVTYFSSIASTLKAIKNQGAGNYFHRISSIGVLDGFIAESLYAKGYHLIVFDSERGAYADARSDNHRVHRFFHFLVIGHVSDKFGDDTVRDACKAIGDKIIGKMLKDRREYLNNMHLLKIDSIKYEQVGPLGSGWFGLDYSFLVNDERPDNSIYNEADWI